MLEGIVDVKKNDETKIRQIPLETGSIKKV